MRPTSFAISAACILIAACASAPRSSQEQGASPRGSYFIVARTDSVALRGTMEVLADSVTVDFDKSGCRVDPAAYSSTKINYLCDPIGDLRTLRVIVDRHDPVHATAWRGTLLARGSTQVCAASMTPHVACQNTTVAVEREVAVGGTLIATHDRP